YSAFAPSAAPVTSPRAAGVTRFSGVSPMRLHLLSLFAPLASRVNHGPRLARCRPRLERLEDRTLLAAAPHLLKDLNTAPSPDTVQLTAVGPSAFFVNTDNNHGAELWVTNGSTAGTHLVKDIRPGTGSSNPTDLTNIHGTLFF